MKKFSLLKKVALFCCVFFSFSLYSQVANSTITTSPPDSYVSGELVILLKPNLSAAEKQAARDYYSVTDFNIISDRLELWSNIPFPVVVNDNGTPVTLLDEYSMLVYIHNNTSGGNTPPNGSNDPNNQAGRGGVNGGDYNHIFKNPESSPTGAPFDYDPLLACPADDYRLYGNTGPVTNNLPTVVLMDQAMTLQTPDVQVFFNSGPTVPSGVATHADQMFHVIDYVNTANGLDPEIVNLVIFDEYGRATYTDFLRAILWLETNGYTNLLINMSGSARLDNIGDNTQTLLNRVNNFLLASNSLLITSAGNEGLGVEDAAILPGAAVMSHEITVAGTESCFTKAWEHSNRNDVWFEIAAEANEILVPYTSTSWMVSSGTSFSTCQATAVLTQIASNLPFASATNLRNRLLNSATEVSTLTDHCYLGRVINATAATTFNIGLTTAGNTPSTQSGSDNSTEKFAAQEEMTLQVAPNPTSDVFTLYWNSGDNVPAQLELYNNMGQLLSQRTLAGHRQSMSLSMQELAADQAGVYFLRIRQKEQVQTRRIILQR